MLCTSQYNERNDRKMQAEKFLVIGSDKKMQACRSRLNELGFEASCCDGESLKKRLPHYRSIILPIPTVANGFISGTSASFAISFQRISSFFTEISVAIRSVKKAKAIIIKAFS